MNNEVEIILPIEVIEAFDDEFVVGFDISEKMRIQLLQFISFHMSKQITKVMTENGMW